MLDRTVTGTQESDSSYQMTLRQRDHFKSALAFWVAASAAFSLLLVWTRYSSWLVVVAGFALLLAGVLFQTRMKSVTPEPADTSNPMFLGVVVALVGTGGLLFLYLLAIMIWGVGW